METTYWIIGDNVRRLRMENGLTQEELAEKALLSPKGIQKVEAGRSGMYVETFIRIASALDVSLDILADMGKMGRQQRAQIEAFYMISHGKSPEEIQYTVEGDRAKRITQARGEVSGTMTYINSALAGSAHGAIAGYAFCMAPYAAPALLYGTGAGYAGSMVGLSEEMMISLTETALYALNFSNIVVQGSDMVESTTGKNALRDALGDDLYRMVGQVSETGAAVTVIAGLSNPDYYVKNNQAAHFEQVPRADGLVTNRIPDNNSTTGHIFRDAEGHIPDTPENRALLENIANDAENFRGIDKYGNEWYTKILENGREVWVESRNGNIFEGGINEIPKSWNPNTGLKKQ